MGNIERVRTIYEKFIEIFPNVPRSWIKFAEFEKSLEEYERFRSIFELALKNNMMYMPEVLWMSYIDNEFSLGEV